MLAFDAPLQHFYASPHRFLFHAPSRTAILSDLHIGAHISLARQGIFLPDTASPKIAAGWQSILQLNPAQIIINGDLFDTPNPDTASVQFAHSLFNQVPSTCRLLLIPGNHDPIATLTPLFPRIPIVPATDIDGFAVIHGNHSSDAPPTSNGLIVGHQHPAVTLSSATRSVKMPCFVAANLTAPGFKNRTLPLIILPAFSPLPLGSDLLPPRHWILDFPRPANNHLHILGIIDATQVLNFGPLSRLPT